MRTVSRTCVVALIVALLALAAPEARQAGAKPAKLALVGGMLIDGYDVPPVHHAAILIEGDRIVQVGPAAE